MYVSRDLLDDLKSCVEDLYVELKSKGQLLGPIVEFKQPSLEA